MTVIEEDEEMRFEVVDVDSGQVIRNAVRTDAGPRPPRWLRQFFEAGDNWASLRPAGDFRVIETGTGRPVPRSRVTKSR